jgi:hypothetical protein
MVVTLFYLPDCFFSLALSGTNEETIWGDKLHVLFWFTLSKTKEETKKLLHSEDLLCFSFVLDGVKERKDVSSQGESLAIGVREERFRNIEKGPIFHFSLEATTTSEIFNSQFQSSTHISSGTKNCFH